MTSLSTGAKIWAKTVFFNACLQCMVSFFTIGFWDILKAMIYLFAGFAVTLPLILITVPLVALSTRVPYAVHARIAWLVFYLIVLVVFLCCFWSNMLGGTDFRQTDLLLQLAGTIIASILLAVLTTRKSLFKLNNQTYEQPRV